MDEKDKKNSVAKSHLKYERENCTKVGLKFNNKTDAEVVNKLKSVSNKTDYIRQLVLNDINSKQN